MAKIPNPEALLPTPEPGAGGTSGGIGGIDSDFIGRLNETITNFKGLLELAAKQQAGGGRPALPPGQPGGQEPASEIAQLINIVIAYGYGDTKIGKLIGSVAPMTINQIKGALQNAARPK